MTVYQKLYFLLVIFTIIVYTQQQVKDPALMAKWNKGREECAVEEGVDLAMADKVWAENSFPDDPKLKCFYKCTNTKLGVLDASGDVVDEALGFVASQLDNNATKEEIVEECGPLKGTDLCDTAYALMKCVKAAKLD